MNLVTSIQLRYTKGMTKYPPESAGSLRTIAVPVFSLEDTVDTARLRLSEKASTWDTISYIYVLEKNKLYGVLSIQELLQATPTDSLSVICVRDLVTVRPSTDQETVAYKALKYNIKAVPVTKLDGTFLGIVDTDTILQTLYLESAEDLARLAGIDPESAVSVDVLATQSVGAQIRARAPYLLLGLAGGVLAAMTVGRYETVLEEHVMVAAFIPLVVYLADAVGSQIQIIFIRALALQQHLTLRNYITQEVVVNIALGAILSIVIAVVSYLWLGDIVLSTLLPLAVFSTSLAALVIALLLPLILRSLGKDPALGSGPLATVCIDITSLVVYFLLASWLLL